MQFYGRVIKQGNSLVIPLTKGLRDLGIKEGDWVKLTIELPEKSAYSALMPNYDPTRIGRIVLRTVARYDFSDEELRKLISQYDSEPKHVDLILQYVKQAKRSLENTEDYEFPFKGL